MTGQHTGVTEAPPCLPVSRSFECLVQYHVGLSGAFHSSMEAQFICEKIEKVLFALPMYLDALLNLLVPFPDARCCVCLCCGCGRVLV